MAKFFDSIGDEHAAFMLTQPLFFVSTAPTDGRINLSPKGLDGCFAILDPNRVAFLNHTGSGNETAAHLLQDSRITLMFCAFAGAPGIVRLYGRAKAVHPRDDRWGELIGLFGNHPGARQVIEMEVASVNVSCGFGVPLMEYQGQRSLLPDWAERKGADGLAEYQRQKNATSFDGAPTGLIPSDENERR